MKKVNYPPLFALLFALTVGIVAVVVSFMSESAAKVPDLTISQESVDGLIGDELPVPLQSPVYGTAKECHEALHGQRCQDGCDQRFTSCCQTSSGWIMCNPGKCPGPCRP